MEVGCVTFGMKSRKKPKNTPEITVYKARITWRFGGVSERHTCWGDIWVQYIQHMTSEQFTRCSQSGVNNHNR